MSLVEIIILALIAVYIIVSLCFHLDPRVAIATALALLVVSAITLGIGMQYLAEQLAICTYYFLLAGVVLLFIDHIRKGSKRSK